MKTRPDKQQVNGMVVNVLVNGPTRVVVEVSGKEPETTPPAAWLPAAFWHFPFPLSLE